MRGRNRVTGSLEEAHGGTLYIDEVADMPKETQGKILRVLTDQNFQRIGGGTRVFVDVRIVSSSSRDLGAEIAGRKFPRGPVFISLGVVPLYVPSLAERRDDIVELVDHFMGQISASSGLPVRTIGTDALAILQSHDWPGNIRQLRNNIERLMIMAAGDPEAEVTAEMLPQDIGSGLPPLPAGAGGEKLLGLALRDAQRDLRARISHRPDQPLRRQYLAHLGIHRHGALRPPSQVEIAWCGLIWSCYLLPVELTKFPIFGWMRHYVAVRVSL